MIASRAPAWVVAFDLSRWMDAHVAGLDPLKRGPLAEHLITHALRVLEDVSVALTFKQGRWVHVHHANEGLTRLRSCAQLARARGLMDGRQLEHVFRLADELGRMLGGWERNARRRPGVEERATEA